MREERDRNGFKPLAKRARIRHVHSEGRGLFMSVKRLIQEEEIKRLLDRVIPMYSRAQCVPLRVPCSSPALATLVGTAFDYAFRVERQ